MGLVLVISNQKSAISSQLSVIRNQQSAILYSPQNVSDLPVFFIDTEIVLSRLKPMNEIPKTKIKIESVPPTNGYYYFADAQEILFCSKTANLQKSLRNLLSAGKDDKDIFELISRTQNICFQSTDSLFLAMLEEKKITSKSAPEFNQIIKPFQNFIYLAIDFDHPPYLKISEQTTEKFYYLGPFTDRFFLYDFIDAMGDRFRLPVCPDEDFPCPRLPGKKCEGWCLQEPPQILRMIVNFYLQRNDEVLTKMQQERNDLESALEFGKAAKLKSQQKAIEKYYDLLRFLHVTKELNFDLDMAGKTVRIQRGLISKITENGVVTEFPIPEPVYREVEFLAHDKSEFTERIIIYRELIKNKLEQIEDICKKSVLKMNNELRWIDK